MCHALSDPKLYPLLFSIDLELAARAQASGCAFCGGELHSARYPRKPRGGPRDLGVDYDTRLSFCCARCRRRTTPVSARFLGRRVYLASVVVLVAAMQPGAGKQVGAALCEAVGVRWRTLRRWRGWWKEIFVGTAFWKVAKARFMPAVDTQELPGSLLARFVGEDTRGQLTGLLRFLSPLSVRAGSTLAEVR